MAIHFTFIASFVMPRKISYQHQWEELKNSHLGVSITSNVITSNDITSIAITSNDLFVMCSIAGRTPSDINIDLSSWIPSLQCLNFLWINCNNGSL